MNELWKPIEGCDGIYFVSNMGRIKSIDHTDRLGRPQKGRFLTQHTYTGGYLKVKIRRFGDIKVHRAVAKAFVSGYFEGAQVNHKDENRQNNRFDNLEWVTAKENANYGNRNKKCIEAAISKQGCVVEQYDLNGVLIATYPYQRAAANAVGVSLRRMCKVIDTSKTSKGYRFKRKNHINNQN